MEVKIPNLRKGNCLIFLILFWLNNPKARITIKWNKDRNVPSFIPILNNKKYIYKPHKRGQRTKLIFNRKVFIV